MVRSYVTHHSGMFQAVRQTYIVKVKTPEYECEYDNKGPKNEYNYLICKFLENSASSKS